MTLEWKAFVVVTCCRGRSSSSSTRFMCSSSSASSAGCWGAWAAEEEALPLAAGPPEPRLRLLLLPPDSRSWFISKSQLATSCTFAKLSEEEKVLTCCRRDKTGENTVRSIMSHEDGRAQRQCGVNDERSFHITSLAMLLLSGNKKK